MTFPSFSVGETLRAADMNAVGMWKIGAATISGQTTVSINNCFSSNYDNYRVIFSMTGVSANANLFWRLRVGGVDSQTQYYWGNTVVNYSGASAANNAFNANEVNPSFTSVSFPVGMSIIDLTGVAEAVRTTFIYKDNFNDSTNQQIRNGGGVHAVTTAYDGITFGMAGGATMSGTLRVYGYRD
jgi:hypothetical protein